MAALPANHLDPQLDNLNLQGVHSQRKLLGPLDTPTEPKRSPPRFEMPSFVEAFGPETYQPTTEFVVTELGPLLAHPPNLGEMDCGPRIDEGKALKIGVAGFDTGGIDDSGCVRTSRTPHLVNMLMLTHRSC